MARATSLAQVLDALGSFRPDKSTPNRDKREKKTENVSDVDVGLFFSSLLEVVDCRPYNSTSFEAASLNIRSPKIKNRVRKFFEMTQNSETRSETVF